MDYAKAWQLQDAWAAEIGRGERSPTLLLLEHPPTYTFGRRGRAEHLLWDEAELSRRGVSVFWVDRGGDVTYHGPGQLVGYPLLPLTPLSPSSESTQGKSILPKANYIGYLRQLEEVLIQTLGHFGVSADRLEGKTGVWMPKEPAKIAAIGVRVDGRGISRHGFALNVAPDMSYWEGIIACGLTGAVTTSLAALLEPVPDMAQVIDALVPVFGDIFNYKMVELGSDAGCD